MKLTSAASNIGFSARTHNLQRYKPLGAESLHSSQLTLAKEAQKEAKLSSCQQEDGEAEETAK